MAETPADYTEIDLDAVDDDGREADGGRPLPARRWGVVGAVALAEPAVWSGAAADEPEERSLEALLARWQAGALDNFGYTRSLPLGSPALPPRLCSPSAHAPQAVA